MANRRGVVFHQDNARPNTSVVTRQDLWDLGWDILIHPSYSPDLAPNDYHLFLALQNFLSDKKFGSREDCENRLLEFFTVKSQVFYDRGIIKLPLKCSEDYDKDLTKNIHSTIVEDRKAREEKLRIEEREEKKLHFEQLRLDEQKHAKMNLSWKS
ncbi:histone-lysine N-methyltransferase SETMAR [Trichonephila clavipes]|nr:histone-lysine N-methyltransferase SETMAR [Trichonephila clavipes]